MLSIDYIRKNKEKVLESAKNKGYEIPEFLLDNLLKQSKEKGELIQKIQKINADRNKLAHGDVTEESKQHGKKLKEDLKELEESLKKIESDSYIKSNDLNALEIPNIASDDSPIGEDEEIKKVGKPPKFDFKIKDHLELGQLLDIIDIQRATKVSGSRFYYLKNEAVLLEFALVNLAIEILTKEDFIPIVPPVLINRNIALGMGYWNRGGHKDYYWVLEPDKKIEKNPENHPGFYLVGTAEQSIVPMHASEILKSEELPKRYVGFSTSFRREAGSYGKDTKGIFRVHQFDKVEMVSFVSEEDDKEGSFKEHEFLLSLEEKLWNVLDIPYRIIRINTKDLGFPIARKYDIEAWLPSQERYREVTSTSTTTDFQARRFNIKYTSGKEKKYAHILNGTAFAIGRALIAILENHQQKDGSVKIPKALQKYTGFSEIKPK